MAVDEREGEGGKEGWRERGGGRDGWREGGSCRERARAAGTVPKWCPKAEFASQNCVPEDFSDLARGLVPKLCPDGLSDVPI